MSSFDLWPFEGVRSVGRRGELEILTGTAPDGMPVTIVRVAPEVASDGTLRQLFKSAVEASTRLAGADDPPILWADTATLVPWAATYDDEAQRGADLIGGIFASGGGAAAGAPGVAPTQEAAPGPSGEKSIPALDGPDAAAAYPGMGAQPTAHAMPPNAPQGPGMPPFPPPPTPPGGQPPGAAPGGPPGGGPPKRGSRAPLFIALGVGGLVLVLLLGTGISLGLTRERDPLSEPGTKPPTSSSSGTPTVQFSPGPSSSSPTPTPTMTTPTLKSRKPVSVYGPTWKKGDKTYTMSFGQLGWSFRAPGDYDCLVADNKPRKVQVNCLKLGAKEGGNRRVLIVDRKCTGTSCSAAERKTCETDMWGKDRSSDLRRKDKNTKYAYGNGTLTKSKQKVFFEYMGYYYKDDKGNLNRHVFVYGDAPRGKFATQIQKTINDIRTQAS